MTNQNNVIETSTIPCNKMYVAQTSPALEQLSNVNKKRAVPTGTKTKTDAETGKSYMVKTYQYKNIELETKKQDELELNEICSKVQLLSLVKLAEHPDDRVIDFKIADLQEIFNAKRSNLNRQVNQAVRDLVGLSITRTDPQTDQNSKNEPFFDEIVVYSRGIHPDRARLKIQRQDEKAMYGKDAIDLKLGHVYLVFSTDFIAHIRERHQFTLVSPKLFQLKGTAFYAYNALMRNKQINYKKSESRQNTMRIGTLLEWCSNLPTWDEVAKSNRNFYDRIVKPLADALKEVDDQIDYVFLNKDKKQVKSIDNLPLDEFLDSYVRITNWKTLSVMQLDQVKKIKPAKKK